jgi:hypothetical protein
LRQMKLLWDNSTVEHAEHIADHAKGRQRRCEDSNINRLLSVSGRQSLQVPAKRSLFDSGDTFDDQLKLLGA